MLTIRPQPLLDHERRDCAGAAQVAADLDVDLGLQVVVGEGRAGGGRRGGVDEDVDAAECCATTAPTMVATDASSPVSAGTAITLRPLSRATSAAARSSTSSVARDQGHVGALGRQRPSDRQSDAPTAARDHGAAPRQLEIHAAQVIRRRRRDRTSGCPISAREMPAFDPFAQRRTPLLSTCRTLHYELTAGATLGP